MSKKAPTPTAPRAKPHFPIDDRIDEIRARQRAVTNEIVGLESRGAVAVDSKADDSVASAAMRLLDGESSSSASQSLPAGNRLYLLYRERAVIEEALVIGAQRQSQIRNDHLRQALVERTDEWRELVYQTALAVIALRQCNRARERFRVEMSYAGHTPSLVCELGTRLLRTGSIVGDDCYTFLQAVVQAGIMNAKEIENVE